MSQEIPDTTSKKFGIDWRINIQTLIAIIVIFGGQAWYLSSVLSEMNAKILDHDKQLIDFKVNGTPAVRVEISNMKARLDASDGRLDRIERGIDRMGDKLDALLNRK